MQKLNRLKPRDTPPGLPQNAGLSDDAYQPSFHQSPHHSYYSHNHNNNNNRNNNNNNNEYNGDYKNNSDNELRFVSSRGAKTRIPRSFDKFKANNNYNQYYNNYNHYNNTGSFKTDYNTCSNFYNTDLYNNNSNKFYINTSKTTLPPQHAFYSTPLHYHDYHHLHHVHPSFNMPAHNITSPSSSLQNSSKFAKLLLSTFA